MCWRYTLTLTPLTRETSFSRVSGGVGWGIETRGRQEMGYRQTMTEEEEFELSENRLEEITKEIEGEYE